MSTPKAAEIFIRELFEYKGWDLRYNADGIPYAVLPHGFGKGEPGVKLQFISKHGQIRVVGVIEHSSKIKFRLPFVHISIYKGVVNAGDIIRNVLLPRYRDAWYQAQPLIAQWLEEHPEP